MITVSRGHHIRVLVTCGEKYNSTVSTFTTILSWSETGLRGQFDKWIRASVSTYLISLGVVWITKVCRLPCRPF